MELAGLEPATSWVRSRISGFRIRLPFSRINHVCRAFLVPNEVVYPGFPPISVHGGVAYGLQGLLSR
jgi:hypothetical protein